MMKNLRNIRHKSFHFLTVNDTFSLLNKDPAECKADFRVQKADIPLLIDALRMPPEFV